MIKPSKYFLLAITILIVQIAVCQTPADSIDATHYDINIRSINFQEEYITASATIYLTAIDQPVGTINLELVNLAVTGVWLDSEPVEEYSQSETLLSIPLTEALEPGDTAIVSVDYEGVPFHEAWGGFHFSGEYAFNMGVGLSTIPHNLGKAWFPCIDNFTDRASYDIYCTLPEDKMAVAGGLLAGINDNGNGTVTYHWSMPQPVPTYLASLAAGYYELVQGSYTGMNGEIPVDIYVRPQDTNKVGGTFTHLNEILAIFENCMGPYSWDRVGYTTTALGSMEHATNIFIPHSFMTGSTTYESTIAHELAHMWMGDKVTCNSAAEMWINEGWATFFGMYYALALYEDEDGYKQELRNKHGSVLQYCHTPSGDGSYFPLNQIPQEYTYGMSAYDRGATVCQALRFYLGDSLFFATLKAFIDEYAFDDASSYGMRDFMSEFTGTDMSGFFDNFILNSGTPHYSVDSFAVGINNKDLYDVSVYVKQKRKGPAFTGNGNIMEIMFMDDNWNRFTDTVHFNGQTGHSVKMVPFIPSVILADPEEKMCDATTDNCKTIKATGNYPYEKTFFTLEVENIADSAFIQVTHNWAPPDSLREPVPGLRLSDYRYWKIDGIIPAGFQATGKFTYNVTSYLDNTLITSSTDTLVILYRKGASEDWQEIEFEKVGPWNVGNIIVPGIKSGEYTLAVKEAGVGASELRPLKKNGIEIYPNPSSTGYMITTNCESEGELIIYNETGIILKSFQVSEGKSMINWTPYGFAPGTYLAILFNAQKSKPIINKLILLR